MGSPVIVSVVMPVYNEEKYIEKCILSLLNQDYSAENMEWIFVDGNSGDKTVEIISGFIPSHVNLIKILNNPNRTVPYAMNIGIAAAVGKYIIRLDAHSDYPADYISKCIYYLENTDAVNVGGIVDTKAEGFVGNAIAKMLSSPFGVGNSRFRTHGKSGYVDTVPFGAYKKEVFEKYGGYNERLSRNEDNEMNYRIRKNGEKIYLSDNIRLTYYCRDTIKSIAYMALKNGEWTIAATKLCKGSMGARHFIPFVFVISLILGSILSLIHFVFALCMAAGTFAYFMLDIFFSCKLGKSVKEMLLLLILFPIFHISYGFGSVIGIAKLLAKKF